MDWRLSTGNRYPDPFLPPLPSTMSGAVLGQEQDFLTHSYNGGRGEIPIDSSFKFAPPGTTRSQPFAPDDSPRTPYSNRGFRNSVFAPDDLVVPPPPLIARRQDERSAPANHSPGKVVAVVPDLVHGQGKLRGFFDDLKNRGASLPRNARFTVEPSAQQLYQGMKGELSPSMTRRLQTRSVLESELPTEWMPRGAANISTGGNINTGRNTKNGNQRMPSTTPTRGCVVSPPPNTEQARRDRSQDNRRRILANLQKEPFVVDTTRRDSKLQTKPGPPGRSAKTAEATATGGKSKPSNPWEHETEPMGDFDLPPPPRMEEAKPKSAAPRLRYSDVKASDRDEQRTDDEPEPTMPNRRSKAELLEAATARRRQQQQQQQEVPERGQKKEPSSSRNSRNMRDEATSNLQEESKTTKSCRQAQDAAEEEFNEEQQESKRPHVKQLPTKKALPPVRQLASKTKTPEPEVEEEAASKPRSKTPNGLKRCTYCERTFDPDRLERHQNVCQVKKQQDAEGCPRKQVSGAIIRTKGTAFKPSESVAKKTDVAPPQPKQKPPVTTRNNAQEADVQNEPFVQKKKPIFKPKTAPVKKRESEVEMEREDGSLGSIHVEESDEPSVAAPTPAKITSKLRGKPAFLPKTDSTSLDELPIQPMKGAPKLETFDKSQDGSEACQYCSRTFVADRLSKHENVCLLRSKELKKSRKPFDVRAMRLRGTDLIRSSK